MSNETTPAPWYVAGLAFACTGCGRCCAGPHEGYVWVTDDEIAAIAKVLHLTDSEMRKRYVRSIRGVQGRLSLVEVQGTNDCVFLGDPDAMGNRSCSIYPVRPTQCRTWPFWPSNLESPENWSDAARRCPGINRGDRLVDLEEIDTRRNATDEE